MSKSFKKNKLQEQMRDFLNSFLRTELRDPRLSMISFTKVELNPDNSVAVVFWDTFNNSKRGDMKRAVTSSAPKLKSLLSKAIKMRKLPQLIFEYDSQYDEQRNMEIILAKAKGSEQDSE